MNLKQALTENDIGEVKKMLEQGEDSNLMYDAQGTMLMYACAECSSEIVELLLKHGANVKAVVNEVISSLRIACTYRDIKIVKLLLQYGANANEKFPSNLPEYPDCYKTPLDDAIQQNKLDIVEILLEHGAEVHTKDHYSLTHLHNAAWLGYVEIVKILLNYGAKINALTKFDETPLYKACFGGCESPAEGRIAVVKFLLEHGANPNLCPCTGENLLEATYNKDFKFDDIEIIKLLIQHGTEVKEQDILYFTDHGYIDILEMIKKRK